MKPTIKVSIGGLAFNLEEDAYTILNDYLQALKRHFINNTEADEIIADIEYRMCELLQMRLNSDDATVSANDAQEVIRIMGNPKDFEGEEDGSDSQSEQYSHAKSEDSNDHFNFSKRKLFRDKEHGIISGVCSGFAHYLRIDPIIIRIGIIALLILLNLVSIKAAITIGLIYAALVIIIPPARTFKQKVSMTGTDPSIENIEDRTSAAESKRYRGSALSNGLKTVFKVLIGIIAGSVIIALIAQLATLIWLNFDTEFLYATNFLALVGLNSIDFKIAIGLLCTLPLIALFCLLLKIIRSSKFTMSTLASFLIGLCFWFGAAFYVGNKAATIANNSKNSERKTDNISIDIPAKKLTIKLADEYKNANRQPQTPNMLYAGRKMKQRTLCFLPNVRIVTDSTLANYVIEVEKKAHGRSEMEAQDKVENLRLQYSIQDSTIYISPKWYGNKNPWMNDIISIKIKVPANKSVEVEKPLQENYPFKYKNKHFFGYDSNDNNFDWNTNWSAE